MLLFASCAQQATLTGGEKDVTPPVILNQEPPNNTTKFNASQIHLYFDEYVQLANPSESFLVSPPLKNQPEYTLKGKSLIININNQLEENTTYIITCNQGIKDLTEGNFLPLTTVIFSTGDYIDSLSLAGKVKDALTLLPEEKVGVLLYKQHEDSALLRDLPYYYTTADKEGKFLFSNIAQGEYQLYALVDKNKNYLFDQSDEKVAFSTKLVKPIYIPVHNDTTDSSDTVDTTSDQQDSVIVPRIDYSENTLLLFQEQDTTIRFLKREFKGNYRHDFIFKNGINDFKLNQISNLDTVINYLTEYNKTKDTISVFMTTISHDLVDFELLANDKILDTISFNPSQVSAFSSKRLSQKTDTVANYLKYTEVTKGELNRDPNILFAFPVDRFDLTKCILIEERKNGNDTLSIECYFADSIRRSLAFKYPFKEKTKYTILCPDSTFWSYYGSCNDTIEISFTTKSSKDYGSIRINYQFYEQTNYILQLLSEKLNVIQEDFTTYNKNITYNYLRPGKYRVRVILDANDNKRWDSGNYNLRQQPEEVIYFEKTIELTANWKIEETFDVVFE